MADIVSPKKRSQMMAAIRSKGTRPEITIRRALFARGFRYRLNVSRLPGKPDLVFPRYQAVVFVNGCFWHRHDCELFKWPSSRQSFWRQKLNANFERDQRVRMQLNEAEWRFADVWECALKGKNRLHLDELVDILEVWLLSSEPMMTIRGN